jgi:hypothetical protein
MSDLFRRKHPRWVLALVALAIVFTVTLIYIVLSGTGVMPGDAADTAAQTRSSERVGGGQPDMAAWPWGMIVLLGTIILGVAIGYGQYQSSRTTEAQDRAGEKAARKLYKEEEG